MMNTLDATGRPAAAPSRAPLRARRAPLAPRVFRMVIVALIYFVLEFVGKALILVQLGFVLATHAPNPGVDRFARGFARWMEGVWSFVTFAREQAPWPFSPWPGPDGAPQRDAPTVETA